MNFYKALLIIGGFVCVNSLKCYTGRVVTSTHDLNMVSPVKLEDCGFSKKQCTKVTYNMTEKVNQAEVSALVVHGICIDPLAGCNLMCEQLRKKLTLNHCEETCCKTDRCNADGLYNADIIFRTSSVAVTILSMVVIFLLNRQYW